MRKRSRGRAVAATPLRFASSEYDVAHRTPYPLFLEVEAVQGRLGKEFVEGARLGACLQFVELRRANDDDGVPTAHGDALGSARRRQAHDFAELRLGLREFPGQA